MPAPRIFICTACALAALAPLAPAATFTLNPTQDAFVSSANSTSNYGAAGALLVDAAGLPKGELDSLLQFNLAAAKSSFDSTFGVGNWTIQSIQLQLVTATPNNGIFNSPNTAGQFTLSWMQNDSWVEGTGTPAAPTTTGITFATLSSFRGGSDEALGTFSFGSGTTGNSNSADTTTGTTSTYTLGLTANFLNDVKGGNNVSLLALPTGSAIIDTSNSENFTTAGKRPVLTITAVPEPGAAGLIGSGVLLGLLRRRRMRLLS